MTIYIESGNKVKKAIFNNQNIGVIHKGSATVFTYVEEFSPFTVYSTTSWVVPAGIKQIKVDCVAAQGQTIGSGAGGKGGRVQCVLKVSPHDTLYIHVGVVPSGGATASYNASDVRINGNSYSNRVVVAGGGGSGSWASTYGETYASGGAGGGTTGGTGGTGLVWGYSATAGTGGSNAGGGAGGTASTPYSAQKVGATGGFGLGGNGATHSGIAGAGGAGYYGGGGGATSAFVDEKTLARAAGGAGGGSSYTNASLCSSVTHTQGFRSGNGYVTISMV